MINSTLQIARLALLTCSMIVPIAAIAQKGNVERPMPKPKAAATPSPTPVPKATVEKLTSINEISDVKPADPHFEALQSLIERYGIGGLTRNKRFNGNANLTGSDFEIIDKNLREMLTLYLLTIDYDPEEVKKYEPRTCPIDTKRLMFTEKTVADYLECSFHPKALTDLKPTTAALTRSRYVFFVDEILGTLDSRFAELEAKAMKAREEAKLAAAPKPTPAPTPPLKLIIFSDRPGDFWNFVPGSWDADMVLRGEKLGRVNWKFSQRSGNNFTLTLDARSDNPENVRVWTIRKPAMRFGDTEYHTVNFDFRDFRFEGYIIVGGALKGSIIKGGQAVGTWTAYRRIDVDYADLAAAAAKAKRNAEAIEYYSKAIKVRALWIHLLARGNLYYDEGLYDQAVGDFSQVVRFDPHVHAAFYNRSLAYYKLARYREADADATTIITKHLSKLSTKERSDVHVQRGWCQIALGDKTAAIADFREALRIDPNSAAARKALRDAGVQP